MKKSIYAILLLPPLILSMTPDGSEKPSQLVLNNSEPFTPQVLRYFNVHQSLQDAYKRETNQEDLRFLAHRLYYLTVNLATTTLHTYNTIPEDQVNYAIERMKKETLQFDKENLSLAAIAQWAWGKMLPKMMSIADRQDWTPEHSLNVTNNFWSIYYNTCHNPERTKQKEEYDQQERKRQEHENLKFRKKGK